MSHTINDRCTACGICLKHCPVDCIVAGDIYKIDPEFCIDCTVCASVCPAKAVIFDSAALYQDYSD